MPLQSPAWTPGPDSTESITAPTTTLSRPTRFGPCPCFHRARENFVRHFRPVAVRTAPRAGWRSSQSGGVRAFDSSDAAKSVDPCASSPSRRRRLRRSGRPADGIRWPRRWPRAGPGIAGFSRGSPRRNCAPQTAPVRKFIRGRKRQCGGSAHAASSLSSRTGEGHRLAQAIHRPQFRRSASWHGKADPTSSGGPPLDGGKFAQASGAGFDVGGVESVH